MNKETLSKGKLIEVDIDESYERMSWLSRIFNVIWIVVATLLPYNLSHKLLVQSKKAEIIKLHSTRYRALEEMYTFQGGLTGGRERFFDSIWLTQRNPRALRNRLKLFKKILEKQITDRAATEAGVRVLSLGSGSARGVVESIAKMKTSNIPVKALLVDKDIDAIEYSKQLSKRFDVHDSINQFHGCIEQSYHEIREFNPNIIEMVGILDYFKDERVKRVLDNLFDMMEVGSTLITANINKNLEERFIARTVKWKMVHRHPREFYRVLAQTKFKGNFDIIYEPLMVHGVAVLTKPEYDIP